MTHPKRSRRALAAMLLLRGGVHALFAVWLLTSQPDWVDIFRIGSSYALVDGVLGLAAAALVAPLARSGAPRLLGTMTLLDALGRLALGIALRMLPGLAALPMTVVPLFGAVGLSAASLGLIAMTAWVVARVRGGHSWSIDADELFDPLAAAALISFVIGATLFVSPPSSATALRVLATSASAGLTIVFLVASVGAFSRRSPTIAHA
jgi:hypothetical protein